MSFLTCKSFYHTNFETSLSTYFFLQAATENSELKMLNTDKCIKEGQSTYVIGEPGSACVNMTDSTIESLRTKEPRSSCVAVATDSTTGTLRIEAPGSACVSMTGCTTGTLRTEAPGSACVSMTGSTTGTLRTEAPGSACVIVKMEPTAMESEGSDAVYSLADHLPAVTKKHSEVQ